MTMLTVQTWTEIIAGRIGAEAAAHALARLLDAPWLENLGSPSNRDHEVERVSTWPDALRVFPGPNATDARTLLALDPAVGSKYGSDKGTSTTGTLNAPFWLLLRRLEQDEALNQRTVKAANAALDTLHFHYAAKPALKRRDLWPGDSYAQRFDAADDAFLDTKISLTDYLTEYVRLLFIEIHAGDIAPRCTYFRDQVGWIVAGFLPCGWSGACPDGRLRVF